MEIDNIYRVIVRTTNSLQPGYGATSWQREVVYCGPSLCDARVAYLREEPNDRDGSYGNSCRETRIERHDAEPEEIDDRDGDWTLAHGTTADLGDDQEEVEAACVALGEGDDSTESDIAALAADA